MPRYLSGLDREEERRTQTQLQGRARNKVAGPIETEIGRAIREAADLYAKEGSLSAVQQIRDRHEKNMREALMAGWEEAARLGGRRILEEAKRLHGRGWVRKFEPEDFFEDALTDFLQEKAGRKIVSLTGTTLRAVQQRLQVAEDRGLSVEDVAGELRDAAPTISGYRSMIISRTETHAAFNAGHKASAEASELDLSREWVSAQDERTRSSPDDDFDHLGADGEIVGVREHFQQTGEPLEYPGDPDGSAANVIHCRCGVADIVN